MNEKKVVILSVADLRHMTMISLYTSYLENNNIRYDIICMDRYSESQKVSSNIYRYAWNTKGNEPKIKKVVPFLKFRGFALKLLRKNDYSFIIVWNENTTLLFSDFLLKQKNKNKYCINIRDLDFSKIFLANIIRRKVIYHSAFTTSCVPLIHECLPQNYNYTIMISKNDSILKDCEKRINKRDKNKPIRISYIGKVRFIEEDKKIIRAFGNDKRYLLQFFGTGAEQLESFIKENGYQNVVLKGTFDVNKTAELLAESDVIHSYFGKNIYAWEYFLPIRFGYAPYIHLPTLVTPGSHLASIIKEYKIGFIVNNFDTLANDFYKWYDLMNYKDFMEGCENYCEYVDEINKKFYEKCDYYIGKI